LAQIDVYVKDVLRGAMTFDEVVDVLMSTYSEPQYRSFKLDRSDFELELRLALAAPDTADFPPRTAIKSLMVRRAVGVPCALLVDALPCPSSCHFPQVRKLEPTLLTNIDGVLFSSSQLARGGHVLGFSLLFFAGIPWHGGPYTSLDSAVASAGFFYDLPAAVLFADKLHASCE